MSAAPSAYVAGRFGDWREVRKVQEILTFNSYQLSWDWTPEAEKLDGVQPSLLPSKSGREIAYLDIMGAQVCDLFVLVCCDQMLDGLMCWIELGVALNVGTMIHVIRPHRDCPVWHMPTVETFPNMTEWRIANGMLNPEIAVG